MRNDWRIERRVVPRLVGGKEMWAYDTEEREVRVMAMAEGYAMVRIKGCMPYVVPLKDLHPLTQQPPSSEPDQSTQ